jgi:hypothetical protein
MLGSGFITTNNATYFFLHLFLLSFYSTISQYSVRVQSKQSSKVSVVS